MSTMYKPTRKKIKIRKFVSKVRRRVLYAQYRQLLFTSDFYVPLYLVRGKGTMEQTQSSETCTNTKRQCNIYENVLDKYSASCSSVMPSARPRLRVRSNAPALECCAESELLYLDAGPAVAVCRVRSVVPFLLSASEAV